MLNYTVDLDNENENEQIPFSIWLTKLLSSFFCSHFHFQTFPNQMLKKHYRFCTSKDVRKHFKKTRKNDINHHRKHY